MPGSAPTTRCSTFEIPPDDGRLLSWLHANAEVLEQETAESGAVTARFRIDPAIRGKLDGQLKRAGLAATRMSTSPVKMVLLRTSGEADPSP